MNPLSLLFMLSGQKGTDQFSGAQTSDLKSLTDALAAYKQTAGPDESTKSSQPQASPIDRIKAAFESLKDMHKTDPNNSPSPLDAAQWPYGPVGAPSAANAQAPQGAGVPMPMARPASAPQAAPADQGNPMMSLFQRSAAMQQDPSTGAYIDPTAAASANAMPGILSKLFG